jgi:hypothetical protein
MPGTTEFLLPAGVLNGISFEFQLYSKLPLHISSLVRLGMSVGYDLLASVSLIGYIWAFRASWSVTADQFVLVWMVLWWLFHIHHLYLDACTAFFPLPALPFILLTWIITNNIFSTISPFKVNIAFYKWSYALPANEVYIVLQDILVWGRRATASPAPCRSYSPGGLWASVSRPTATSTAATKPGNRTPRWRT